MQLVKKHKTDNKLIMSGNLKDIIEIINSALIKYKTDTINEGLDISEFKKPVLNKKRNGSNNKLCDGLKVYSFLAKEILGYSWADIGFQAGEREHSTMLWHYRQFNSLYFTDKEFKKMADLCREKTIGMFNKKVNDREMVVDKCNSLIEQLPVNVLRKFYTQYNSL